VCCYGARTSWRDPGSSPGFFVTVLGLVGGARGEDTARRRFIERGRGRAVASSSHSSICEFITRPRDASNMTNTPARRERQSSAPGPGPRGLLIFATDACRSRWFQASRAENVRSARCCRGKSRPRRWRASGRGRAPMKMREPSLVQCRRTTWPQRLRHSPGRSGRSAFTSG